VRPAAIQSDHEEHEEHEVLKSPSEQFFFVLFVVNDFPEEGVAPVG
jgi:hypothetical protein